MKKLLIALLPTFFSAAVFAQVNVDTTANNVNPHEYSFPTIWKATRLTAYEKGVMVKVAMSDPRGGDFIVQDTTEGFSPDNLTVIAIPGTSLCLVRQGTEFNPRMAYAFSDSVHDGDDDAIQKLILGAFAKRRRTAFDVVLNDIHFDPASKNGRHSRVPEIWLSPGGVYVLKHKIIIPSGIKIHGNGATIIAVAPLDYMFQTPPNGQNKMFWNGKDSIPTYRTDDRMNSQPEIVFDDIIFVGNNLASTALRFDNTKGLTITNSTFLTFSYRQWQDSTIAIVQKQTTNEYVIIPKSATPVIKNGAIFRLKNPATDAYTMDFHRMRYIKAGTTYDTLFMTSGGFLHDTAYAGYYLDFVPAAIVGGFTHAHLMNLRFWYNGSPLVITDGITINGGRAGSGGDNDMINLKSSESDFPVAVMNGPNRFIGCTFQHSTTEQIFAQGSRVSFSNTTYVEAGAQFKGNGNEKYPLVFAEGSPVELDLFIPSNNNQNAFIRRIIEGYNTLLLVRSSEFRNGIVEGNDDTLITATGDTILAGNPAHPSDVAYVKMLDPTRSALDFELWALSNLGDPDSVYRAVTDANYNTYTRANFPYVRISARKSGKPVLTVLGNTGIRDYNVDGRAGVTTEEGTPKLYVSADGSSKDNYWTELNSTTHDMRLSPKGILTISGDWQHPFNIGPGVAPSRSLWVNQSRSGGTYGKEIFVSKNGQPLNDSDAIIKIAFIPRDDTGFTYKAYRDSIAVLKAQIASLSSSNTTAKAGNIYINLSTSSVAASSTVYAITGQGSTNAAINNRSVVLPQGGTISRLTISTNGTQSSTGDLTFTVMKNGVATAITKTIVAGGGGTVYYDPTNSVHFSANDELSIMIVNAATASSAGIRSISMLFLAD